MVTWVISPMMSGTSSVKKQENRSKKYMGIMVLTLLASVAELGWPFHVIEEVIQLFDHKTGSGCDIL